MVVNAVFSGVEHDDKLGHEWEKVHGHAKSTRSFLASNGISLLFGMFCLTHGPKMLRCHILARAVRYGITLVIQMKTLLSAGTGVTGVPFNELSIVSQLTPQAPMGAKEPVLVAVGEDCSQ